VKTKILDNTIEKSLTGTIDMLEYSLENVQMGFLGGTVSTTTQSSEVKVSVSGAMK